MGIKDLCANPEAKKRGRKRRKQVFEDGFQYQQPVFQSYDNSTSNYEISPAAPFQNFHVPLAEGAQDSRKSSNPEPLMSITCMYPPWITSISPPLIAMLELEMFNIRQLMIHQIIHPDYIDLWHENFKNIFDHANFEREATVIQNLSVSFQTFDTQRKLDFTDCKIVVTRGKSFTLYLDPQH